MRRTRGAQERPYYLALGDSLAVGIQPDASGLYKPTAQGYADDLHALYRARLPGLQLVKLGCSGETEQLDDLRTSISLLVSGGKPIAAGHRISSDLIRIGWRSSRSTSAETISWGV